MSTQSNFLLDRVIGSVAEAGTVTAMCRHPGEVYDSSLM